MRGKGGLRGLIQREQLCTSRDMEPKYSKLWRSTSIFNLWGQVSMYGRGVMYNTLLRVKSLGLDWLCVHAAHICVVRHNRMHESHCVVCIFSHMKPCMGFNTVKYLLYCTAYLFFTFNRSDALALP